MLWIRTSVRIPGLSRDCATQRWRSVIRGCLLNFIARGEIGVPLQWLICDHTYSPLKFFWVKPDIYDSAPMETALISAIFFGNVLELWDWYWVNKYLCIFISLLIPPTTWMLDRDGWDGSDRNWVNLNFENDAISWINFHRTYMFCGSTPLTESQLYSRTERWALLFTVIVPIIDTI